jgi:NADH-quinone oxidoreductase subunit M
MSLLDMILFLPLAGFLIALLLPNGDLTKKFVLAFSLLLFVMSLGMLGPVLSDPKVYSYDTTIPWISTPKINYHVGIDGLSIWLVVLATFLTPIAVIISWKYIEHRQKEFFAYLLLLEFGMIGVFVSLDLFLFYVFWEVALVPMYMLIGIWGHDRRIYAAVKFFLYTLAGSVLMLAAMIFIFNKAKTFDYVEIVNQIQKHNLTFTHTEELLLFLAFFLAFAIKVPLFPLHTWLPDAHVEAPTAGSVMLASVMLKMGTYGLVRFCLPLFPGAAHENAGWINMLAIIGIVYGALVAMVQPNIKKLVAYSSVSHLGFVVLGIFSFTQQGLDGAVYVMLAHGISTGALFMLVGMLYERKHSLDIKAYGGVATPAPNLTVMFVITMLASVGLPMLCNFVGEFLVLQGAALANFSWTVGASIGVILSAVYMLWMVQRVFYGRVPGAAVESGHGHGSHAHGHDDHGHADHSHDHGHEAHGGGMPDLTAREWLAILPMIALMVWGGVYSQTFLPAVSAQNTKILELSKDTRKPEWNTDHKPAAAAAATAGTKADEVKQNAH